MLGAINAPGLPLAFEAAAGTYLKEFKNLLMTALDDGRRPASKIDAAWEQIPGFGGDKQIAKKIVATYYPDEILPIFARKRMECHAQKRFGTDVNGVCRKRYGMSYADVGMTAGKRWELLSEALLDRKDHHPRTRGEDHVFFMYVLEHRGCS